MAMRYCDIEDFVAERHRADLGQTLAIKARLRHLRRCGIVEHRPGTGRRVAYDTRLVWKIAVAMELGEFGVDPMIIVEMLGASWGELWGAICCSVGGPLILRCDLSLHRHRYGPAWRLSVVDGLRVQPGMRRVAFIDLRQIQRDLAAFHSQGA